MTEANPYQPPASAVVVASVTNGFIAHGRTVDAGRGWAWVGDAWAMFVRHPIPWIIDGLVFAVVVMALPYMPPVLGWVASALLTPVILGGLMLGADAVHRGDPLTFGHIFAGFQKNTGTLLGLGFIWLISLTCIVVLAAFIMGFGLLATLATAMANADPVQTASSVIAIILGSITSIMLSLLVASALLVPVMMMFWFAPALVVLHDMGGGAALRASFAGCLKNIMPIFLYGLVMLVLSTVAAIPLMLGFVVLIPVTIASVYTGYRDIFLTN